MSHLDDMGALIPEKGWPMQRLRMGWSLILFFFFETQIGRQLPLVIPILSFGLGVACLVSATRAIREWKLNAQIAVLVDALDRRPR
jgi:hypothetical protein